VSVESPRRTSAPHASAATTNETRGPRAPGNSPGNSGGREVSMRVTPFLMFTGQAQSALDLYVDAFPDSRILDLER